MLLRAALVVLVLLAVYVAYRAWRLPPRRLRRIGRLDLQALGVRGPAILQFSTPACSPCKAAAPRLRAAADHMDVRFAQIDVAERPEVARRYGIRTVPTIAVVERGGGILGLWTSLPPNGEIADAVRLAEPRAAR